MLSSESMPKREAPRHGRLIGATVRHLRHERGWTLGDLSEKTDISVSGLSQLENGKTSRVRRENVRRLADAFSVSEETFDLRRFGERVANEVQTVEQRELIDAVLSLPPDLAEEAKAILAELAKRRRSKK